MKRTLQSLSCATLILLVLVVVPCLAQQGQGNECTPAGTWYGGSVVAYLLTITPAGPAGHYSATAQAMVKGWVMNTTYVGTSVKKGKLYEGPTVSLTTQDPGFLNPPPPPPANLPDITVGWVSMEMVDCDTIRSTIPFLGTYFGPSLWRPGTPWTGIDWLPGAKTPLLDPPDVDLIPVLTGDVKPIVETYHRVPVTVNPDLLHQALAGAQQPASRYLRSASAYLSTRVLPGRKRIDER